VTPVEETTITPVEVLTVTPVEVRTVTAVQPVLLKDEYHCLNETSKRIGPEGGRIEVLPDTWVVIDKETFTQPSLVKVQASLVWSKPNHTLHNIAK